MQFILLLSFLIIAQFTAAENTISVPDYESTIPNLERFNKIDIKTYHEVEKIHLYGTLLMPKPTAFVKFKNHNQKKVEGFNMTEPLEVGLDFLDYCKGKIAILVNEETQSNAEYTQWHFR